MYGKQLKRERKIHGYSQSELAKKIGITQAQISYYEKDINIPNLDITVKIANVYGITVDELIGRDI